MPNGAFSLYPLRIFSSSGSDKNWYSSFFGGVVEELVLRQKLQGANAISPYCSEQIKEVVPTRQHAE